ncbi:MAG: uroporphyrinogen decarboxylase family protein [Oscillospiraceae bacterium]|jgi:uroporphyrinogen decarboxylase|nr:uroporphyrinogen decarboxylase family protein [Oscillospiraceae bacterium]
MNNRERALAVLRFQAYDRLPIVHFGFWNETLIKWHEQGHLTRDEAYKWGDSNAYDDSISQKLGFDFNWSPMFGANTSLSPAFVPKVIRELGGGTRHVRNEEGVIVLQNDAAISIPAEIEHLLVDRKSWEELYAPKLRYHPGRVDRKHLAREKGAAHDRPYGLHVGSLYGNIRNWLGVVGSSYLLCDDEELYTEIIDTVGELTYRVTQEVLDCAAPRSPGGLVFDYAHFWEDICFKNGPLISPSVFREKVGPHYKRITELLRAHGIDIVSLDCDGCIDALLPVWLENGVNTMFPIEVGTWGASIAPWRERYGRRVLGVGGMNKTVFSRDFAAVDAEVERLKALVALGGYIPCPDHRIAPDAKWENVVYYTKRLREAVA